MNLVFPRLYAIIDPTLLAISELDLAEALAGSGVELIQYRNKTASSRHFFEISRQLSSVLGPRGVRLIVNDRADIQLCWLAQAECTWAREDLGVEDARAICGGFDGNDRWVGVSTHTLAQLAAADRTTADYIAFGPVFPTTPKKSRPGRRHGTFAPGAADDEKAARRGLAESLWNARRKFIAPVRIPWP